MRWTTQSITRDDLAAGKKLQQALDGTGQRRRLVLAELARSASRLRQLIRIAGSAAITLCCVWTTMWVTSIHLVALYFLSALLTGAAGVASFWWTRRANERRWKSLLQCAMKLAELNARVRLVMSGPRSKPEALSQIAEALNAESAKLAQDVDALFPPPKAAPHRRLIRYKPTPRLAYATITLEDGTQHAAKLLDLSRSEVTIAVKIQLSVGSKLKIERTEARVLRSTENGFVLEFLRPFSQEVFSSDLVL